MTVERRNKSVNPGSKITFAPAQNTLVLRSTHARWSKSTDWYYSNLP